MKMIRVRAVEGCHVQFFDRNNNLFPGRWVGWTSHTERSTEPVEVHECQFYRDAINQGSLEEVTAKFTPLSAAARDPKAVV